MNMNATKMPEAAELLQQCSSEMFDRYYNIPVQSTQSRLTQLGSTARQERQKNVRRDNIADADSQNVHLKCIKMWRY